jgi:hypothetical protein
MEGGYTQEIAGGIVRVLEEAKGGNDKREEQGHRVNYKQAE